MPVFTPPAFTIRVDAQSSVVENGVPLAPPANGTDKYTIFLHCLTWEGVAYQQDIEVDIFFSDLRPKVTKMLPYDVNSIIEVTSTTPGILELTIVDKTPGSSYFTRKSVIFGNS
jgi:hypothetical protein